MSLWTVVGFGTVAIGAAMIGALAELSSIGAALCFAGAFGLVLTLGWRLVGARA
jgi:hypothetical protein